MSFSKVPLIAIVCFAISYLMNKKTKHRKSKTSHSFQSMWYLANNQMAHGILESGETNNTIPMKRTVPSFRPNIRKANWYIGTHKWKQDMEMLNASRTQAFRIAGIQGGISVVSYASHKS